MNPPPIFFLHKGESPYLYYVVKQARRWNPDSEIIVLCDGDRRELRRYAKIVPIDQYSRGAEALTAIYEHHSANPYGFELFCFQRWFVLRDFLAANPASRLVHLDSDVLTYTSFASEFERLGSFDVGIVGFQGPQSMLIANSAFVPALCDHITRLFTEEAALLAAMYAEWKTKSAATAVSDMHAIHTLLARGEFRAIDLAVVRDAATYDGVIHESEGYAVAAGQKELSWRNGQPWGVRIETNEPVRFNSLHCQGPSKYRILEHFRARDLSYYLDRLSGRMSRLAGK